MDGASNPGLEARDVFVRPEEARSAADRADRDASALLGLLDRFLDMPLSRTAREGTTAWPVKYLTYPALVLAMAAIVTLTIRLGWNVHIVNTGFLFGAMFTILAIETLFPLERTYSMTWRTLFKRDLKFIVANRIAAPANGLAVQLLSLWVSQHHRGLMTEWPLWLSIPAIILVCEIHAYWWHRFSHSVRNPLTRFMWRIHAAHHLPEQVYVMMQPVSNPLDTFSVFRPIIFFLCAASPATVLAVNSINTLQGLVRHANIDMRTGWLNYLIVGTELHRMHHSADEREAKNFASLLSVMDILFGTFVYAPGRRPRAYGVVNAHAYPRANQFWRSVLLPFKARSQA